MSASATIGASGPSVLIRGRPYPVQLPTVRDPRLHLAAVIVSLQVLGQTALGFRLSVAQILVSVLTCAVLEVGITFWRRRVLMWPASALLTGNGVAFVLRVPGTEHGDWWSLRGAWIFAATSAVALLSKYVIRFRGGHVFNPSNFGLVLCFLVLSEARAEPLDFWWGPMSPGLAVALVLIVVGGLTILSRLRLLGIAVAFWIAFAAAVGVLALSGHSMTARWHLGPISDGSFWWVLVSSPEILVFLFFMITDPKTVPAGRVARLVYAVAVGLLAALLIAPQTTEYGTKVAVLGALALVCAARPVIEWLAPYVVELLRGRRVAVGALALAGAAGFISLLVVAGAPARSSDAAPSREAISSSVRIDAHNVPRVTVVPSRAVASRIDRTTALRMARDLVASLRIQADALRRRDLVRAATGAGGAWLGALRRRIRASIAGGPIIVPTYHVERMWITLAAGDGQAGPAILATVQGTVRRATYIGSPPRLERRAGTRPARETFRLSSGRGRYLIVAATPVSSTPGAQAPGPPQPIDVSLVPATDELATAQGSPFAVRTVLRNRARATATTDLELSLAPAGSVPVTFFRSRLLVPGRGYTVKVASVVPSQRFGPLGSYRIAAIVDGRPAGRPLVFDVTRARILVPRFEDVTKSVGLETRVPAPGCGEFTSGAAWADVNRDGYPDILVTRLGEPVQLFVSNGHGRFRDEAAARGLAVSDVIGAAFADYDNDGYSDLYLARKDGDMLFHNDGTGHFADVTGAARISNRAPGSSVTWGDYNGDGHLDVYVASYVTCVGKWTTPYLLTSRVRYYPDKLYRNNGNGTFTDVTSLLGLGATRGAGLAAAWLDYNADNRPDLYLGNDFIGAAPDHNRLWRNDGPTHGSWKLTDVSEQSETAFFMNTMGIGVGDFNRDLKLDLALSNIGDNRVLRNNGNGTFSDVASSVGAARPLQQATQESVTWGLGSYDFNLDGWADLYLAAGNIVKRAGQAAQTNELFVNDGTGRRFLDLSAPSGADDPGDSKGVAFADYDLDGRMDIFVLNQGGAPRLYRNITPRGEYTWLEVEVEGTVSNRDGCGARVVLTLADGSRLTGQVSCSGNQHAVHFGLGKNAKVAQLDIIWPSGIHQELRDPKVDRIVTVKERRS